MVKDEPWPAQWLRGVLELCVLALVCEQETYGYALAQRLEHAGFGRVKGGTLYPILLRLEQEGLVTSTWREGESGPGRKFFRATELGRVELLRRAELWSKFVEATDDILPNPDREPSWRNPSPPTSPR